MYGQAGLGKKYHNDNINDYPDDIKEEYAQLCDWIRELGSLYKDKIMIRVIDTNSIGGVIKSLRHRTRKYPTFIINNGVKYTGWDKGELDYLLKTQMIDE